MIAHTGAVVAVTGAVTWFKTYLNTLQEASEAYGVPVS
jgi:hypothetical protein